MSKDVNFTNTEFKEIINILILIKEAGSFREAWYEKWVFNKDKEKWDLYYCLFEKHRKILKKLQGNMTIRENLLGKLENIELELSLIHI